MNSSHTAVIKWVVERQRKTSYRQLIMLSRNEKDDCALAEACLARFQDTLWVGKRPDSSESIESKDYIRHLGQSKDCVVYNAYSGFRPNAVAGLEGCIQYSGLFILITPNLNTWSIHEANNPSIAFSHGESHSDSVFTKHFIETMKSDRFVAIVSQSICRLPFAFVQEHLANSHNVDAPSSFNKNCTEHITIGEKLILNQEQSSVFSDINQRLVTQKALIAVITSPRGRGKSTLLGGIACAVRNRFKSMYLCSSIKAQSEQVIESFHLSTKNDTKSLTFIPPDQLEVTDFSQSLVIIDEAANIPSHIFLKAVCSAEFCLVATTEIGYEGTGLGFTHKIKPLLSGGHPSARFYELKQPVRWHPGDTLELLFLKFFSPSAPKIEQPTAISLDSLKFQFLDLQNERQIETVRDCFALLVDAHYQTSQDDLMRLLDATDQTVFVAMCNKKVVGCAVIIFEGLEVSDELSIQICKGERRLSGHLASQSIASITMRPECLKLKNWRVNRIAVMPYLQSRGIGTELINRLVEKAAEKRINFLSTSFGIEAKLFNFWKRTGFELVRIGPSIDKKSGLQSALMIKTLAIDNDFFHTELHQHWTIQKLFLNKRKLLPEFYQVAEDGTFDVHQLQPLLLMRLATIKSNPLLIKNNLAYIYVFSILKERSQLEKLVFDYLKKGQHKHVKAAILKRIQTIIQEYV